MSWDLFLMKVMPQFGIGHLIVGGCLFIGLVDRGVVLLVML